MTRAVRLPRTSWTPFSRYWPTEPSLSCRLIRTVRIRGTTRTVYTAVYFSVWRSPRPSARDTCLVV